MNPVSRRIVLKTLFASAALALGPARLVRAQTPGELRLGWQKGGDLAVVRARGTLDRALAQRGVSVRWIEFPAGPQMLEALAVGSIDLGEVGETPPVFSQAAGAELRYVANRPPSPREEALLVPQNSPLRTVADLAGKRVVLNKGSNVHYLLLRLLETAGLSYRDVKTVFLPPADARSAFERGAVDAWVIWEPFASAAEMQIGARRLADATGAAANHNFMIAARAFTEKAPDLLRYVLGALQEECRWIGAHVDESARIAAPQLGLSTEIVQRAFRNYAFGLEWPLSESVVQSQQRIADAFYALGLLPRPVSVRDVVWAG